MSGKSVQAALLVELDTFRENLYWLIPRHVGHWALVKGQEISVYATREDALAGGLNRYGATPWLAKQVLRYERET